MAKTRRELTEAELGERRRDLARGRETAAQNRAAKAEAERAEPAEAAEEEKFAAPRIAAGGVAVQREEEALPEAAGVDGPAEPTAFERFLASLDAETRDLLSEDELLDIFIAQIAK